MNMDKYRHWWQSYKRFLEQLHTLGQDEWHERFVNSGSGAATSTEAYVNIGQYLLAFMASDVAHQLHLDKDAKDLLLNMQGFSGIGWDIESQSAQVFGAGGSITIPRRPVRGTISEVVVPMTAGAAALEAALEEMILVLEEWANVLFRSSNGVAYNSIVGNMILAIRDLRRTDTVERINATETLDRLMRLVEQEIPFTNSAMPNWDA